MDGENLKNQIGSNIARFRRQAGLTQAGLAERLNYSDKAISKWERGESIPDVLTLVQLAELFGITVNALVTDPKAPLPASQEAPPEKPKANKRVILALSSTLVWFVALLVYVIFSSVPVLMSYSYIAFFFAVPVNAIVALSLLSAWGNFRRNKLLISIMVWGFLIAFYFLGWVIFHYNFWKLFLLGIPGQIAIFLWFRLFGPKGNSEQKYHKEETSNG